MIDKVTKPDEFKLSVTSVWSMMPVMGRVLLPGTRVMSLIVVFPTTPALRVARLRVTLPFTGISTTSRFEA